MFTLARYGAHYGILALRWQIYLRRWSSDEFEDCLAHGGQGRVRRRDENWRGPSRAKAKGACVLVGRRSSPRTSAPRRSSDSLMARHRPKSRGHTTLTPPPLGGLILSLSDSRA